MQTEVIRGKLAAGAVFTALILADGAALAGLRTAAARSWRHLPHLGRWVAITGCDKALAQLAAAALWLAAAWLAIGLFAALASTLPGWPGRLGAAACRRVLPHAARRLLAGTAGLGVLLAPAAAMALSAQPTSPIGMAAAAPYTSGKSLPPPTWPATNPAAKPTTQPRDPGSAAPSDVGAQSTVRVRRGDCLWLLARRRLPPGAPNTQIAAYWPRWYAANRDVVGADPDLLHPGEVLRVPAPPAPSFH